MYLGLTEFFKPSHELNEFVKMAAKVSVIILFPGIRVEEQIAQEEEKPPEKLDLALKEGQTIKVNINMPKKDRRSKVSIKITMLWYKT